MARRARVILPGIPHHVTQRGNRRQDVFFTHGDRKFYLAHLRECLLKYYLELLAYCLMTNHVHPVLAPESKAAICRGLLALHTRYAKRINHWRDWSGHLWQGRYFSSPLDSA